MSELVSIFDVLPDAQERMKQPCIREEMKRLLSPPDVWRSRLGVSDKAFLARMRETDKAREEMRVDAAKLPSGRKRGWIGGGA